MSASLESEQIGQFNEDGFLIIPDVLSESFLNDIEDDYDVLLNQTARHLHEQGHTASRYDGMPFAERYIKVINEYPPAYNQLGISLPLVKDASFMPGDARVHASSTMLAMLTHPNILDVVESIIGPEILSNPVQHTRIKPPTGDVPTALAANTNVGTTIWHQDQSGYLADAAASNIVTVWVAVTDATPENGCLMCVRGNHKPNELTLHCPQKGRPLSTFIPNSLIDTTKVIALPVRRGGIILLHRLTQHASLPNRSRSIRWSFDLRYNPVGEATGRPCFPAFVARSRAKPQAVLSDAGRWQALWDEAHRRIVRGEAQGPLFNDMTPNALHPLCA